MKLFSRLFIVALLVSLLLQPSGGALAQAGVNWRYVSETGHNLQGDFLRFYDSHANALQVFGYPITDAFTDPRSGRLVQYFTRARFEYHADLPEGQRVRLSPVGQILYQPGNPLNIFTPVGCRSFSNGNAVCYAFLDFFDKNGGEVVFGMPISGFEVLNGRIVQHFQNARFEWYPENAEGSKVVLAELGRAYFSFLGEDPLRLNPTKPLDILENPQVLSIQARAFSWKAVTQANDVQTVYVVVQDQTLKPVKGAEVSMVIYFPNGSPRVVPGLLTNEYGVVIAPFEVSGQPPGGLVLVAVQVKFGGLTSSAMTSFRIWQ